MYYELDASAFEFTETDIEFKRAILSASVIRLRPLVMIGLTTIVGNIPLIIVSGAGAETRLVIGAAILVGVLASTLLTLFVGPVKESA